MDRLEVRVEISRHRMLKAVLDRNQEVLKYNFQMGTKAESKAILFN